MSASSQINNIGNEGLPLISVQGLRTGDHAEFKRVASAIGQAAREIGFFRICDHGIDLSLIEATYASAASFFSQPTEKTPLLHWR